MKTPQIHPSVFVAPGTFVLGDVTLEEGSSVFFGAVIRSEYTSITVGPDSNIQDNCVLHTDPHLPMTIGRGVTVGHGAILHSCTVDDNSLIGMGAIVLNGAHNGKDCIIAAGALIPQNAVIPDGSLVIGSPGKVRRTLAADEIEANRHSAQGYVEKAAAYKAQFSK